jgi:hypothetical protein
MSTVPASRRPSHGALVAGTGLVPGRYRRRRADISGYLPVRPLPPVTRGRRVMRGRPAGEHETGAHMDARRSSKEYQCAQGRI